MDLSSGLALKVVGGLSVLALGSTGIYFANDYFQNSLTKFDQGLINVLKDKDQDIVFTVTESNSGTTDAAISTSFPTFTSNSSSILVKVIIDTSNANQFAVVANPPSTKNTTTIIEGLKKLNKNGETPTQWTWACEIKLIKPAQGTDSTDVADKDLLWKNDGEGFFNILQKNLATDTTTQETKKDEWREKKIKFIKNCASNRGLKKNKEINNMKSIESNNDVLKTTKEFSLAKGDTKKDLHKGTGKQEEGKLYFSDYSEFKNWFE